jgi:hypothetical protein
MRKHTGGRSARKSVAVMLPNTCQHLVTLLAMRPTLTGINKCKNALLAWSSSPCSLYESCDGGVGRWINGNALAVDIAMMS